MPSDGKVKITIRLDRALVRDAKIRAAECSTTLGNLVDQALHRILKASR